MEFKPIELSVYEDYMNHYRQCMKDNGGLYN